MTKAGKLEEAFLEFKEEVLSRLEKLEEKSTKESSSKSSKKPKDIIMETNDNDIVAKEE